MGTLPAQVIRIFIADNSVDSYVILKGIIDKQEDMILCGYAALDDETVQGICIQKPDIVILCQTLMSYDVINVLGIIKNTHLPLKPQILVLSENGSDENRRYLRSLGAQAVVEKQYDPRVQLIGTVRQLCDGGTKVYKDAYEINNSVKELGFRVNVLGYRYVNDAVRYILQCGESERPTMKEVYLALADNYGTDWRCVESAVTSAVKEAALQPTSAFTKLMQLDKEAGKRNVSAGRFLRIMAESIRLQHI